MNPDFVHVFLDKMQRYSVKADRALFLAGYQETYIAFATVINQAPSPEKTDKTTIPFLEH